MHEENGIKLIKLTFLNLSNDTLPMVGILCINCRGSIVLGADSRGDEKVEHHSANIASDALHNKYKEYNTFWIKKVWSTCTLGSDPKKRCL